MKGAHHHGIILVFLVLMATQFVAAEGQDQQRTRARDQLHVLFVPRPTASHIRTPFTVALQMKRLFESVVGSSLSASSSSSSSSSSSPSDPPHLLITFIVPNDLDLNFTVFQTEAFEAEYQQASLALTQKENTTAASEVRATAEIQLIWDAATHDRMFPARWSAKPQSFQPDRVLSSLREKRRHKRRPELPPNYALLYRYFHQRIDELLHPADGHHVPPINMIFTDAFYYESLCDLAVVYQLSHGCMPILESSAPYLRREVVGPFFHPDTLTLAHETSLRNQFTWPAAPALRPSATAIFSFPNFFPDAVPFDFVDYSSSYYQSNLATLSTEKSAIETVSTSPSLASSSPISSSSSSLEKEWFDPSMNYLYAGFVNDISEPYQEDVELFKWLDEAQASGDQVVFCSFGHARENQVAPEVGQVIIETLLKREKTRLVMATSLWTQRLTEQYGAQYVATGRLQLRKWVNQRGVLAHEAVRLFVSHCGYGSVRDAIVAEKPIIGSPILPGQDSHCLGLQSRGAAECLLSFSLSEWKPRFANASRAILDHPQPYFQALRRIKQEGFRFGEGTVNAATWILHQLLFEESLPTPTPSLLYRLFSLIFFPLPSSFDPLLSFVLVSSFLFVFLPILLFCC